MNAIVVGVGTVAEELGTQLRGSGWSVAFIATSPAGAESLAGTFPDALVLLGAGTFETALKDARAEKCDVVFSVGPDDAHTLVASLLARERFGVARVVALTQAADSLPAFEALSVEPVCAPAVLAREMIQSTTTRACS